MTAILDVDVTQLKFQLHDPKSNLTYNLQKKRVHPFQYLTHDSLILTSASCLLPPASCMYIARASNSILSHHTSDKTCVPPASQMMQAIYMSSPTVIFMYQSPSRLTTILYSLLSSAGHANTEAPLPKLTFFLSSTAQSFQCIIISL